MRTRSLQNACSDHCRRKQEAAKEREAHLRRHIRYVPELRICRNPSCGRQFLADMATRYYCGSSCARVARLAQDAVYRAGRRSRAAGQVDDSPGRESICELCRDPFVSRSRLRRYCSKKCHSASYRRRRRPGVVRRCSAVGCGKVLPSPGVGGQRYCSGECARAASLALRAANGRKVSAFQRAAAVGGDVVGVGRRQIRSRARDRVVGEGEIMRLAMTLIS